MDLAGPRATALTALLLSSDLPVNANVFELKTVFTVIVVVGVGGAYIELEYTLKIIISPLVRN